MTTKMRPIEIKALELLEGELIEAAAEAWGYSIDNNGYIIRAELAACLWPIIGPHFIPAGTDGALVRWAVEQARKQLRLTVLAEYVARSVRVQDAYARQRREAA